MLWNLYQAIRSHGGSITTYSLSPNSEFEAIVVSDRDQCILLLVDIAVFNESNSKKFIRKLKKGIYSQSIGIFAVDLDSHPARIEFLFANSPTPKYLLTVCFSDGNIFIFNTLRFTNPEERHTSWKLLTRFCLSTSSLNDVQFKLSSSMDVICISWIENSSAAISNNSDSSLFSEEIVKMCTLCLNGSLSDIGESIFVTLPIEVLSVNHSNLEIATVAEGLWIIDRFNLILYYFDDISGIVLSCVLNDGTNQENFPCSGSSIATFTTYTCCPSAVTILILWNDCIMIFERDSYHIHRIGYVSIHNLFPVLLLDLTLARILTVAPTILLLVTNTMIAVIGVDENCKHCYKNTQLERCDGTVICKHDVTTVCATEAGCVGTWIVLAAWQQTAENYPTKVPLSYPHTVDDDNDVRIDFLHSSNVFTLRLTKKPSLSDSNSASLLATGNVSCSELKLLPKSSIDIVAHNEFDMALHGTPLCSDSFMDSISQRMFDYALPCQARSIDIDMNETQQQQNFNKSDEDLDKYFSWIPLLSLVTLNFITNINSSAANIVKSCSYCLHQRYCRCINRMTHDEYACSTNKLTIANILQHCHINTFIIANIITSFEDSASQYATLLCQRINSKLECNFSNDEIVLTIFEKYPEVVFEFVLAVQCLVSSICVSFDIDNSIDIDAISWTNGTFHMMFLRHSIDLLLSYASLSPIEVPLQRETLVKLLIAGGDIELAVQLLMEWGYYDAAVDLVCVVTMSSSFIAHNHWVIYSIKWDKCDELTKDNLLSLLESCSCDTIDIYRICSTNLSSDMVDVFTRFKRSHDILIEEEKQRPIPLAEAPEVWRSLSADILVESSISEDALSSYIIAKLPLAQQRQQLTITIFVEVLGTLSKLLLLSATEHMNTSHLRVLLNRLLCFCPSEITPTDLIKLLV